MKLFIEKAFIRQVELSGKIDERWWSWADYIPGRYSYYLKQGEAIVSFAHNNLGKEKGFRPKLICAPLKEAEKYVEIRRPRDEACYEMQAHYVVDCNTIERQKKIRCEGSKIDLMIGVRIISPTKAVRFECGPRPEAFGEHAIGVYLDKNLEHYIIKLKSFQKGLEKNYETELTNNLNLEYERAGVKVDYLKMAISRRHENLDNLAELITALEEKGFRKEQIGDVVSRKTKQILEVKNRRK